MTRSTVRIGLAIAFVVADFYQLFFWAWSSVALAAPGVGDVSWVPKVLAGEAFTILPIGYILCLWGSAWGLRPAAVCAGTSIVLALAASIALAGGGSSVTPLGFPLGFAVLALPGLVLAVGIWLMRRVSPR